MYRPRIFKVSESLCYQVLACLLYLYRLSYPAALVTKQRTIRAVAVGNRVEAVEVLDFAACGIVKSHYRLEKLENLTEASVQPRIRSLIFILLPDSRSKVFEEMSDSKLVGRVVLEL